MESSFLGIDPGLKGGLVVLDQCAVMTDFSTEMDSLQIADFIEEWDTECARLSTYRHVFLEKAQAMPKNGAVSMFNYGVGYGTIIGILITIGVKYTLVPPATWAKTMHAGTSAGKPKQRSLEAIKRLYPGHDFRAPESKSKKMHEGLVDAYLIAEYGRRQFIRK